MTRIAARTVLVALAALTATAATASADEIDRRQFRQDYRIEQGLRSGDLTRREAAALAAEQARIRDLERRAKADGYVSPYERARLRAAQNEASRHIRQERHDDDNRGRFWGRYSRNGYDGERRGWWRSWY